MPPKKTLILGAGGQLGRALRAAFPGAEVVTRAELDVTDAAAVAAWPWHEYAVVLNAAAYTAVDAAETPEGRRAAWAANATAPATLARLAARARLHPRARLLRLRLRRHRRGARRGRAAHPARGLRADQGRRRHRRRHRPPPLPAAHVAG